MRLFLCAALTAAVLLVATGCGSDNSSTTAATAPASVPGSTAAATTPATGTTTGTPTTTTTVNAAAERKTFIKKVNPICEDYNREVQAAQKELAAVGKSGNVDVYAPALKRATKAAKRASKRYDAVEPPRGQEAEAALIGRALQAQATGNELLLQAANADDPQQFGVATQALQQVTPKLQAAMRQYGMTVCGAPK